MQARKQQLELDMEQQTGSKSGKEYVKAVYCHPAYLTYAEYIMRNAGLDEAQAGIKVAGRHINNLIYADDTSPMAESEELKSSWPDRAFPGAVLPPRGRWMCCGGFPWAFGLPSTAAARGTSP